MQSEYLTRLPALSDLPRALREGGGPRVGVDSHPANHPNLGQASKFIKQVDDLVQAGRLGGGRPGPGPTGRQPKAQEGVERSGGGTETFLEKNAPGRSPPDPRRSMSSRSRRAPSQDAGQKLRSLLGNDPLRRKSARPNTRVDSRHPRLRADQRGVGPAARQRTCARPPGGCRGPTAPGRRPRRGVERRGRGRGTRGPGTRRRTWTRRG